MVARLLLSGIAVVTALLGCAGPQGGVARQASPECSVADHKCKLDILVLDCTKAEYGVGYTVTNPNVDVTVWSTIEWTIVNQREFRFRQDIKGIEIDGWRDVFDQPKPEGRHKYSWRDKHTLAGSAFAPGAQYYYKINIERNDGGPQNCVELDPWITNY